MAPFVWAVAVIWLGCVPILSAQSGSSTSPSFESGALPARWTDQNADCEHALAFRLHEYKLMTRVEENLSMNWDL